MRESMRENLLSSSADVCVGFKMADKEIHTKITRKIHHVYNNYYSKT